MSPYRFLTLLIGFFWAFAFCVPVCGQDNQEEVGYVIERYIETLGGRASLEKIRSVRLSGKVIYPNGLSDSITVLKKKPDLVRVVLDKGMVRFVQAYDGKVAWFARESGRDSFYDHMRGKVRDKFIREAPLENTLVNHTETDAVIQLGEDAEIAGVPCYRLVVTFPDGNSMIHFIEKGTFLERRIIEYDADGVLLSELIPASFETIEGVTFARKITRISEGRTLSTLYLDEIQVNSGILNKAFDPPDELPPE